MSPAHSPSGPSGAREPGRDTEFTPTTSDAQPALAVAAVARRLGVAPATLRTWDRRYGLGPTAHAAGSHRRYTADDVTRLMVMRGLTLGGVAPADAARSALAGDRIPAVSSPTHRAPPEPVRAEPVRPEPVRPEPVRRSGTTGDLHEVATPTMLVDAALREDVAACRRLLAVVSTDLVPWWTDLVAPARASLAARTVLARAGEDPEWALDSAALAVIRERTASVGARPVGDRPVLLFAAPHERRPLVLHVLASALTDRGVDARVVTGPVDPHRVLELVAMTCPVAVALFSELPAPNLAVVADLHSADPELLLVVGLTAGRSAPGLPRGRSVRRAHGLVGVLGEVLAASG